MTKPVSAKIGLGLWEGALSHPETGERLVQHMGLSGLCSGPVSVFRAAAQNEIPVLSGLLLLGTVAVPVPVRSGPCVFQSCFRSFAVLVLVSGPLSFQSLFPAFPALFVCWSSVSASVCVFHCISTQGSLVFICFYQDSFLLLLLLFLLLLRQPRISTASSGSQWAQPQAPDLSGHCRTSTASSRSQLPDLNGRQISVGTARPQPRAVDLSGHCRDLSQTPETMSDRMPERMSE